MSPSFTHGFKPGLYAGVLSGLGAQIDVGTGRGVGCCAWRNVTALTTRMAAIRRLMFMSFDDLSRHVIRGSCKNAYDHRAKPHVYRKNLRYESWSLHEQDIGGER